MNNKQTEPGGCCEGRITDRAGESLRRCTPWRDAGPHLGPAAGYRWQWPFHKWAPEAAEGGQGEDTHSMTLVLGHRLYCTVLEPSTYTLKMSIFHCVCVCVFTVWLALSWHPCTKSYSDTMASTYPSFERLPHWKSVAHVSEDPQDDDAGLEICDSGLVGQMGKTYWRHEQHFNKTAGQHKFQKYVHMALSCFWNMWSAALEEAFSWCLKF